MPNELQQKILGIMKKHGPVTMRDILVQLTFSHKEQDVRFAVWEMLDEGYICLNRDSKFEVANAK